MQSYTKLFSSIVTSTIWMEDDSTRIVWITMLAIADKHGEVHASVPGLARVAGVSIEDAQNAIEKFTSPDPHSRTKTDDGRRVEVIDGGWVLINHAKYRALASSDDQRVKTLERVRRHRQRESRNGSVTVCNDAVTVCNDAVTGCNDAVTVDPGKAEYRPREPKAHSKSKEQTETNNVPLPSPEGSYHPDSRAALHLLNEASRKSFREIDANLKFISARLSEPGVTIDGVREMIQRQAKQWLGTDMEKYLRPETLFNATKFDSYYADRNSAVIKPNRGNGSTSDVRNFGVAGADDEGKADRVMAAKRARFAAQQAAREAARNKVATEVDGHGSDASGHPVSS